MRVGDLRQAAAEPSSRFGATPSTRRASAMRDLLTWNVSLGRWAGVDVRLHVSCIVLLLTVLHLGTGLPGERSPGPALVGLTILFLSVVAHELGHCMAAWTCGG